ncbi:MAG: PadR family transcriptional regulator [Betaproteobacteria bacterium]
MSRTGPPAPPALTDWTSQLRRGVLEVCLLRILCRAPSYGYEIVSRLESLGPLASNENTVYPLLRRLKADGLLETFVRDSPAGPPRQYYRITADGRRRLAALAREWTAMADAVAACLHQGEAS